MAHKFYGSSLEVICGCMFSGKTEELVRVLKRSFIAKLNVLVFKHSSDMRYSVEDVCSHSGITISSLPIQSTKQIFDRDLTGVDLIGIDEAQFFNEDIVKDIEKLLSFKIRVVVAGLDMDYKRRPFGKMPELLAMANKVTKLSAICSECGEDAHYTQRLVKREETILVGAIDSYEPRCLRHHEVNIHIPS